jgi:CRISPR/Cas system CSM-associated protein Csm2 small subunit
MFSDDESNGMRVSIVIRNNFAVNRLENIVRDLHKLKANLTSGDDRAIWEIEVAIEHLERAMKEMGS